MHSFTPVNSPSHRGLRATVEVAALTLSLALIVLVFLHAPSTDGNVAASAEEFPGFQRVENGAYTVIGDVAEEDLHHALQVLADLQSQFLQHFAPVIRSNEAPYRTSVILFNTEAGYRAYARRVAPALVNSGGFFVATHNRLAVLNQTASASFAHTRRQIERRQRRLDHWIGAHSEQRLQASAQLAEWRGEMAGEARAATDRLIRHEGAHQLFHAYGVESPLPVEPTWLTEGLAQYCEPAPIGACRQPLLERLVHARRAGMLLPLRTLLNHRDPAGFFALTGDQVEIAYAESWALTQFLMDESRQAGFFEFIKHFQNVRPPASGNEELRLDVAPQLAGYLRTDFNALETQWLTYVNNL